MQNIKKASLIPVLCLCFCLIGPHAFATQGSPDKGIAADGGSGGGSAQRVRSPTRLAAAGTYGGILAE